MALRKLWGEFKAFAFQGNMIELAVAVVIGAAFGGVVHSLVGDIIMPTVAYLIHEGQQAAEKAGQVAMTAANKVGVAASQPTTAAATGAAATPTAGAPTPAAAPPDEKQHVLALVAAGKITADDGAQLLRGLTPPPPPPTPAPAKADETKPVSIDFNVGPVPVGKFITELINFIILAFAVFIMVVKLLGSVMKKMKGPEKPGEPTTRECPECLSIIPIKAKRCSHCTAMVPPVGTPATT